MKFSHATLQREHRYDMLSLEKMKNETRRIPYEKAVRRTSCPESAADRLRRKIQLSDALANESILDMQGITEAVSRYYYTHNDSFEGIFVPPKYQRQFERLAQDAVEYYEN